MYGHRWPVTNKLDEKLKCYGVFLDLSKAFDTVSVPTLVKKLELIGIRGIALEIFKDYLSDRFQRVKIQSFVSDDLPLKFGVPQGSILGPTLFLVYINDLCLANLENCEIFTYADDTALLIYDISWVRARCRAETILRSIMTWLADNLLTLNVEKTKLIRFFLPNTRPLPAESCTLKVHTCNYNEVCCSCRSLSVVKHVKYLGVYVDEKLDWRAHIENLCIRVRRLIYIFKNLRLSADWLTLKIVYCSLCQSVITYCISVWGGTYKTVLIALERAQRFVLKVMLFKQRDHPTRDLYVETQLLTVRQLYVLKSILITHRHLPLDLNISRRRPGLPVCPSVPCRSAFARKQHKAQSAFLYNKINKEISIYTLTTREVNKKLDKWLQSLTYAQTENLLTHIQ